MLTRTLIKNLIRLSQKIPFLKARGSYTYLKNKIQSVQESRFENSQIEFNDSQRFLKPLGSFEFNNCIAKKTVLDYGSGYGGRTVWLAQQAGFVEGVEIYQSMVDISNEFAVEKGVKNVRFSLGSEDKIFYADNYFDAIISFDVLEHVQKPEIIIKEFYRVLKHGGIAIVIFTPYYGAFSHHLNYITLFPGLHWLFSPRNLIDSINELLEQDPRFFNLGMTRQPSPTISYNGKRECLPTLNGLTKAEYTELICQNGFKIMELRAVPILEQFPVLGSAGAAFNRAVNKVTGWDEYFSHNLVSVLRAEK